MAITSSRSIITSMTGDIAFGQTVAAADNTGAPGVVEKKDIGTSQTYITPPGVVAGVTIKLPSTSTYAVHLMGSSGDAGIALNKADPTSLGLGSTEPFILASTGVTIPGVIFVWT